MSSSLAVGSIENLPATVMACVRAGTWTTPNADRLRHLARLVSRAHHAGFEAIDLNLVLAVELRRDMPFPTTLWTPEMKTVANELWPFIASSIGRRDLVAKERGQWTDIDGAIAAVTDHVADEREKATMTLGDASALIETTVKAVAADHPELGMSFGYIGNVYFSPRRDDRSFMVFTKLRDGNGHSASFGGHEHGHLADLAIMVRTRLAEWAAERAADLKAGRLYRVGDALAA